MVAELLLGQRQVVLTCGISIHVLAGYFKDADCHQVLLLNIALNLFDRLPDNELRWVVIHYFVMRAHHIDTFVTIKIFWSGRFARLSPFGSEFGALFIQSWQEAKDLRQTGDVVLRLHILIRSEPLALLNQVVTLLIAEGLEPVHVSSVLVSRRRLVVDILADIIILDTHADELEKGIYCELNPRLLCLPHVCQECVAGVFNNTTLELVGLLVNEINSVDANF